MKKKIKINQLKVKSFVTNLEDKDNTALKGGFFRTFGPTWCGPGVCDRD